MSKSPFKNIRTRANNFLLSLNKAKYIIMLTGTPIEKELQELRYLINIAANKELIPISDYDFLVRYTDYSLQVLEKLLWDSQDLTKSAVIFKLPFNIVNRIWNGFLYIVWDTLITGIIVGGMKGFGNIVSRLNTAQGWQYLFMQTAELAKNTISGTIRGLKYAVSSSINAVKNHPYLAIVGVILITLVTVFGPGAILSALGTAGAAIASGVKGIFNVSEISIYHSAE